MANKGFTHLHLHSQYSLLDGAIAFDKLFKRCKKLDMDAVAVTDHGNMFGAVEFYTKAIAAHIRPVKYRVYGSDEKGFTIADQRHQSVVGVTKEEMAGWNPWFPANFIAETTATELAVLGADVDLSAANKSYYRVVAVNEQGKRSGPSDYAIAPRPVVYSKPVLTARVGAEYRYQVLANRSLGDLSSRMADDRQTSGYFDIEKPRFKLTQGPAWLRIDEVIGVLSGTPDVPARADVIVTVAIDRQVRKLDEAILRWGREKLLSVDIERVGITTQKFIIDVVRREP